MKLLALTVVLAVAKGWYDYTSLVFTGLLFIVGLITCGVVAWQSWETRRSVLVSLRPKLVIRGIALVDAEAEGLKIECLIANTGGSDARITESNLTIMTLERKGGRLPVFPPYDDSRNWLGTCSIDPAQQKNISVSLGTDKTAFTFSFMRAAKEIGANYNSNMYCFGFIQYSDRIKVQRRIAFCLHYDAATEHFERVQDESNYDYND